MNRILCVASVLAVLIGIDRLADESWAQSDPALASGATGVPIRSDGASDAIAPGGSARSESVTGNPLWSIRLDALTATRERPIFSPARRPPAVASVPVAATVHIPEKLSEPERPQLVLIGTVIGAKDGFGVFVDDTTKSVVRLRAGDDYRGWVLRTIRGRDATLEKGDQRQTLSLPRPSPEPSNGNSRRRE
jgi:hypothetical protein